MEKKMKTPKTKICTKCGKRKRLELFYKNKSTASKTAFHCKACAKTYHQAHKEEAAAHAKTYHQAHKEEAAACSKAYYQSHKEECMAKNKAYYQSHGAEIKAYSRFQCVQLTDAYIKGYLCSHSVLSRKDIPQSIIRVKREQLINHRLAKEQ